MERKLPATSLRCEANLWDKGAAGQKCGAPAVARCKVEGFAYLEEWRCVKHEVS